MSKPSRSRDARLVATKSHMVYKYTVGYLDTVISVQVTLVHSNNIIHTKVILMTFIASVIDERGTHITLVHNYNNTHTHKSQIHKVFLVHSDLDISKYF